MRGYIYTMLAFLILVFVVVLIYINAEMNRTSGEFYSELFRSEAMVFTIESLNEEFIDKLFRISVRYNLLLLTDHTIKYPIRSNIDFSNVMYDLVVNGSVSSTSFNPSAGLISPVNIIATLEALKKEAEIRGINIKYSAIDFSIDQTDYNKLKYSYTILIEINDIYNKTGKILNISRTDVDFEINGMPDPLFLRYANILNVDLRGNYPAIYVKDNPSIQSESGVMGQGWVYGRVYTDINQISDHNEPNIIIGRWAYVSQFKDHPMIDGIIITDFTYRTTKNCIYSDPPGGRLPNGDDTELDVFNDIVHEEVPIYDYDENGNLIIIGYRCERKPSRYPTSKNWIAVSGSSVYLDDNDYNNKTILLLTNNPEGTEDKYAGPIKLYRIEDLRDFVNCGYYFKLPNNAPSYIQRFYENAAMLKSPYGIDVLLIEDDFLRPGVSSMLTERYNGVATYNMIRGLAGCKMRCDQTNATKISTGLASVLGISEILTTRVR